LFLLLRLRGGFRWSCEGFSITKNYVIIER
jgi:hypothetical protein